jgi:prepilin-type N-terminal cleavage/methylation domain-containing protein
MKKGLQLAGFTLVEIMVSVLILGVGLTIVANSYIVALKGANTTSNIIAALKLGREKLDALEISALNDGLSVSEAKDVLKSPTNKSYDYTQKVAEITQPVALAAGSQTTTPQLEDLAKNFVQVCLNLSWQEQNITKNVTLSTYLPKQKQ